MPIGPSNNNATRASAIAVLCATAVLAAVWFAQVTWRSVVPSPGAYRIVQEIAPHAPFSAGTAAHGATGTIDLPVVPITAANTDESVGARPFSLRGVASIDRARAMQCLTAAVYYEAATEGDAGQAAVAQVVLNRVRHPAFPASVCGVVYQGAAHPGCQFSFACDGASAHVPTASGWARAARVAALALGGRVFAGVGLATHYHTYAVTPAWNRSLVMTNAVGAHFFHRWKGYWGNAAAFTQQYRGDEPIVAPTTTQPIISAATPATPTPAIARAVVATAPPLAVDRLPPAAAILDRWKDSGTPLDRQVQRDTR